ncbi:MAG: acyl-CoA synthetase [Zoogloeaceae bacterium]|nr:acyl-CoA synthetase [Zoogloeaceae bacterium]
MTVQPLITALGLDDVVAWLPDGPRRVRDLLADARSLATQLPQGGYLLNVCQDRYRFAVGFCAGLLSGRVSLQPASQSVETLSRVIDEFPDLICLRDAPFEAGGIPTMDFPSLADADPAAVTSIPAIAEDRLAAILFTSGSTGLPQAHRKHWGKLVRNGAAEARRLGFVGHHHAIVGTVPVQHSYGFESTFLLTLHGGSPFWAGKPFYPQDVAAALAAVPSPRLLVTTPFHLANLMASGIDLPPVAMILSATAPLSRELAQSVEERYGAPVHEIYGATECGQLASRRTTNGEVWSLLEGVRLLQDGDETRAEDGHVEVPVRLGDRIELLGHDRFLLLGREADLVNLAGKRTSLAYLNHQVGAIPGVRDAAFFLPPEQGHGMTRLCAFVVAPGLDVATLQAELRRRLDPIFLPRPLVLVESLPRNTTGKLPRQALETLYADKVTHEH